MRIARTIAEMRGWRAGCMGSVGFVPTMGALHAGHASLLHQMRERCDYAVCSIFVNPTQFGPHEDFTRYPRPLEADLEICQTAGVDCVFLPSAEEMYPPGAATTVDVGPLGDILEGAIRPGHFRGVATVVLKLFSIVQPHKSYFGEKDYQQLCIIRRMAADFNLPIQVRGCSTIRQKDGLALSSRNAYLKSDERAAASSLSRALIEMCLAFAKGTYEVNVLIGIGLRELAATAVPLHLDYLKVVDAETLEETAIASGNSRVVVAARIGGTRLIDNVALVDAFRKNWPSPNVETRGATA